MINKQTFGELTYQLNMRHEIGFVIKASATVSAFMWLLPSMDEHMSVHMIFFGEPLLTYRADKDLLIW